jgi:hypothetical protein
MRRSHSLNSRCLYRNHKDQLDYSAPLPRGDRYLRAHAPLDDALPHDHRVEEWDDCFEVASKVAQGALFRALITPRLCDSRGSVRSQDTVRLDRGETRGIREGSFSPLRRFHCSRACSSSSPMRETLVRTMRRALRAARRPRCGNRAGGEETFASLTIAGGCQFVNAKFAMKQ